MDIMDFQDIEEYLGQLEELVNIDSVSSDAEGTTKIAAFMENCYHSLGWQVEALQLGGTTGPCLKITNELGAQEYDILLLAHMDTVFPLGTAAQHPFYVKDSRAYGPGIIDCKAGLLSGFYALKDLQEQGMLSNASICVFLNSDHEGIGSCYSQGLSKELARSSRVVLVLEAGRANGDLINRRKGIDRYHIDIHGVAAHAGTAHQEGRNAIEELAYWVIALQGMTDYARNLSVNVGHIVGGSAINVVPSEASADVDIRYYDEAEAKRVEVLLQDLQAHPHVPDIVADIKGGIARPPMMPTARTEALCQAIDTIGHDLKISFEWATSGGGSDGSFAASEGVTTLDALGPVGGGAHSALEYLEIDSVLPRLQLLKAIICYILCNPAVR